VKIAADYLERASALRLNPRAGLDPELHYTADVHAARAQELPEAGASRDQLVGAPVPLAARK
jgi:hypothetical protein